MYSMLTYISKQKYAIYLQKVYYSITSITCMLMPNLGMS